MFLSSFHLATKNAVYLFAFAFVVNVLKKTNLEWCFEAQQKSSIDANTCNLNGIVRFIVRFLVRFIVRFLVRFIVRFIVRFFNRRKR